MWGWIALRTWVEGNVGAGGNTWHQAYLMAAPDSKSPVFAGGVFVNEDTVLVTQTGAFKIDDPGEFDALVALGHQMQPEVAAALGAITDQVEMTVAGADAALAGGRPTVATPAGDDPILGNLLVTGFSSSEPPQRKSEAASVVGDTSPSRPRARPQRPA